MVTSTTHSPTPTAHRRTLALLGQAILSGQHAPGSALPPEPLLGAALGVSRTVVREAVKSLVAKGLVSTGPKVGTRVQPPEAWNWFDPDVVAWQGRVGLSPALLRDLQELRRVIEPAAVRLAAMRATADDIATIEAAYAGMQRAALHGGALAGDYVAHDLAFHQGLLRASHNRMVEQISKALAALLRTSFEIGTLRPDGAVRSLPLHRAVLDAVIAGRAAKAEKACLALIAGAQQDIDTVLAARAGSVGTLATDATSGTNATKAAGATSATNVSAARKPAATHPEDHPA